MRLITPNRKPVPPVNRRSNIIQWKKAPAVHEHGNLTPAQILQDKKVEREWVRKAVLNEKENIKKNS